MIGVLACVDLSEADAAVIEVAAGLADDLTEPLHLLHVAAGEPALAGYDKEDVSSFTRDDRAGQLLDEHGHLRTVAADLAGRYPTLDVTPLVVLGPTPDQILAEADRSDVRMVVVGSHGHGALHHLMSGSVTEALLRRSRRPLLIIPTRHR